MDLELSMYVKQKCQKQCDLLDPVFFVQLPKEKVGFDYSVTPSIFHTRLERKLQTSKVTTYSKYRWLSTRLHKMKKKKSDQ